MKVRFVPWRELSPALSLQLTAFSPYIAPAFVALFERTGGRGGYFTAENDGGVIAAMPAIELGSGLFRRMQALVDGLPAPVWISPESQVSQVEIRREIVNAVAGKKYFKAYVTDFDNSFSKEDMRTVTQVTSMVDLADAESAGDSYPPDKTLRAEIAKASRDGVQVVALDRTTQMDDFVRLIDSTEARHKRDPKYSKEFWCGLAWLSEIDPRFQILCVNSQGTLAAAHVFIIDRDTAFNWQIYFDKQYSSLKPNQAITAHAIRKFAKEGVRYLNLGVTPPEAVGLETYKSKWGGRDYRYQTSEFRSRLGKLLR